MTALAVVSLTPLLTPQLWIKPLVLQNCEMASPTSNSSKDYKDKLHSRNASQVITMTPEDINNKPSQTEVIEAVGVDVQGGNLSADQLDSPSQPENLGNTKSVAVNMESTEVIKMSDFEVVDDINDKLNLLMVAINKVNTNFHFKWEELQIQILDNKTTLTSKIESVGKTQEELQARVDDLEAATASIPGLLTQVSQLENKVETLSDDVATLKGLMQVQDRDIYEVKNKTVDLTARSMANNVIITGITGDQEAENCREKVWSLMNNIMQMEVDKQEILVAHRIGKKGGPKPRAMVVRCADPLRQRIFKFTANLKGKTNSNGDPYYVSPQLPEPLNTECREREEVYKSIKKANAQIPEEEKTRRTDVKIKNKTLIINNIPQKQHIFPPTVQELFNVDDTTQERMEQMFFSQSNVIADKGSSFRGHALKVANASEIRLAYRKLKLMYPESNHIMTYVVKKYSGYQDNGEFGAGKRLAKILLARGVKDIAVFVTREYGGFHIGARRFLHIEGVAKDALNTLAMQ